MKNSFLISEPFEAYVVGIQKNRLNEMALSSTQNMLKSMNKKIFAILGSEKMFISTYIGNKR